MPEPSNEAKIIVDALFDEVGATGGYPPHGDVPGIYGEDALIEMKEAGFPGWGEVEWGGYYLKFLLQKISREQLIGTIIPYDLAHKRHFVKGNFVWDARMSSEEQNVLPLGDVEEYSSIIQVNGGIGILIANSVVVRDDTGSFKQFQSEMKGEVSEYEIVRELEGRPAQPRKEAFMIHKVLAYFFTLEDLQRGIKEGWVKDTFQNKMRNANAQPRNGKYSIRKDAVPREYLVFVKNFNSDPVEFGKEYPEFA